MDTPTLPTGDDRYEVRITRLTIAPPDECLFSEMATDIEIEDEAAGEFVVVRQKSIATSVNPQEIRICRDEWPALLECVSYLLANSRNH